MDKQLLKCLRCESEYNHITKITNTVNHISDYPKDSYGYRQGAIMIEVTCENCQHKHNIIIGEHKGQIYIDEQE